MILTYKGPDTGNKALVNNDGCHGMRKKSGSVSLTAGAHNIMVRFFEKGGGAGMILTYKGPDTGNKEVVVPEDKLRSGEPEEPEAVPEEPEPEEPEPEGPEEPEGPQEPEKPETIPTQRPTAAPTPRPTAAPTPKPEPATTPAPPSTPSSPPPGLTTADLWKKIEEMQKQLDEL